jgi:hypothetical protein
MSHLQDNPFSTDPFKKEKEKSGPAEPISPIKPTYFSQRSSEPVKAVDFNLGTNILILVP